MEKEISCETVETECDSTVVGLIQANEKRDLDSSISERETQRDTDSSMTEKICASPQAYDRICFEMVKVEPKDWEEESSASNESNHLDTMECELTEQQEQEETELHEGLNLDIVKIEPQEEQENNGYTSDQSDHPDVNFEMEMTEPQGCELQINNRVSSEAVNTGTTNAADENSDSSNESYHPVNVEVEISEREDRQNEQNRPGYFEMVKVEECELNSDNDESCSKNSSEDASGVDKTSNTRIRSSNWQPETDESGNLIVEARFQCCLCRKSLDSMSAIRIHSRSHHKTISETCDICNKKYKNIKGRDEHFIKHILNEPKGKIHQCTVCKSTFKKSSKLKEHMLALRHWENEQSCIFVNDIKRYECQVCKNRFSYAHHLTRHLQTHSTAKSYGCKICKLTFTKRSLLHAHLITHKKKVVIEYGCQVCDMKFPLRSHLTRHLRSHNAPKTHECNICKKVFRHNSHLKEHMVTHTKEKIFACNLCEAAFSKSSNLKRHLVAHNQVKDYKCDLCETTFVYKYSLKRHLMNHSLSHECTICNLKFANSTLLKRHLNIHNQSKKYECQICKNRFSYRHLLTQHVLTHYHVKKFKCDVCGKSFSQNSNLKQHYLTHTKEKKFKCEVCGGAFAQNNTLKGHMLTHNRDKGLEGIDPMLGQRPENCS